MPSEGATKAAALDQPSRHGARLAPAIDCRLRPQAIPGRTLRLSDCVRRLPFAPSQLTEIRRRASREPYLRGLKLERSQAPSIPVRPGGHLPECKPRVAALAATAKRPGPPNIGRWQRWRAMRSMQATGLVPSCRSGAASGSTALSVIDACEQRFADDAATLPHTAANARNGSKPDTVSRVGTYWRQDCTSHCS